MPPSTGLLSIATQTLKPMQDFYSSLLGMDPAVDLEGTYIEFRLTGLRLGLYRSRNPAYRACLGAMSVCLQVADLDAMLALPLLESVKVSAIRCEFHGREVDFCDPDGNRIVLHEPSQQFLQLLTLDILFLS